MAHQAKLRWRPVSPPVAPVRSLQTAGLHRRIEQFDDRPAQTAQTTHSPLPRLARVSPVATELDDTDRALIALLRDDARLPVATLAARLKVARGTVQNRLARLEREGVIAGYTVRLTTPAEKHRLRAIMSIQVEGRSSPQVVVQLRGMPCVSALYKTNGRWDFVAELQADTLEAFDRDLASIRTVPGIVQTETSILLSIHKL